jgi:hypothetical protein
MRSSIHTATLAMGIMISAPLRRMSPIAQRSTFIRPKFDQVDQMRSHILENLSFVMNPSSVPLTFEPHLNVPKR